MSDVKKLCLQNPCNPRAPLAPPTYMVLRPFGRFLVYHTEKERETEREKLRQVVGRVNALVC